MNSSKWMAFDVKYGLNESRTHVILMQRREIRRGQSFERILWELDALERVASMLTHSGIESNPC